MSALFFHLYLIEKTLLIKDRESLLLSYTLNTLTVFKYESLQGNPRSSKVLLPILHDGRVSDTYQGRLMNTPQLSLELGPLTHYFY